MDSNQYNQLREDLAISRRMSMVETDVAVLKTEMETVRESLRAIRELPMQVAELVLLFEKTNKDTSYLRRKIEEREKERAEEREEARLEKKSDRRWFIGTSLTTGAFLIGAAAFFIDKIP